MNIRREIKRAPIARLMPRHLEVRIATLERQQGDASRKILAGGEWCGGKQGGEISKTLRTKRRQTKKALKAAKRRLGRLTRNETQQEPRG